ncbi:MAG: hypothetical protein LIP08_04315 [Bacteroides sp.]|nr:hypothetical protein [Bacteroides sp.]
MKEYSKKEENRSRAMQPQVDSHTQGTMERILQRKTDRKNNYPVSGPIQFVKIFNYTFQNQDPGKWSLVQEAIIQQAIQIGKEQLDKAENYMGISDIIKSCISSVRAVLTDPDLEIYYLDVKNFFALSTPSGPRQISLNLSIHKDEKDIAKSLIHECFHIACQGKIQGETSCSKNIKGALTDINKRRKTTTINPDSFAQFVMSCP